MVFAKCAFILLFTMALCGVSTGIVHSVGDLAGWTIVTPVDYQKWTASKTFHVGDAVVFRYRRLFHNVLRVTHQNFKSCNTTYPIAVYSTGYDSIKLTRPGHYFFVCGLPGHCLSGQKVHIEVVPDKQNPPPHLPLSVTGGSGSDAALPPFPDTKEPSPGPAADSTSSAPTPTSLPLFNFCLALGLGVLAFGLSVNGIGYFLPGYLV